MSMNAISGRVVPRHASAAMTKVVMISVARGHSLVLMSPTLYVNSLTRSLWLAL